MYTCIGIIIVLFVAISVYSKYKYTPPELIEEEECNHDWVVIHTCKWLSPSGMDTVYGCPSKWRERYEPYATDRVCIKCGTCHRGIQKAIDLEQDKWDELNNKEALAKQIWENCDASE